MKTLTFFVRQSSLTLCFVLFAVSALTAQILIQQQKLTASDAAPGKIFGHAVALDIDTALVGAYGGDSAYVFIRSGGLWTQQQRLQASNPAVSDGFGFSVSVSGDTALIGSINDNNNNGQHAGAAYVFTRTGGVWTQQQRLQAADVALNDQFGYSVSMNGDTAVIGSDGDDDGGPSAGSAYIFTRSGGLWTQQQKLMPSGGNPVNFGNSVSLSGDTVIIGAWQDSNAGGSAAGAAYVFTRSGGVWTQQQKLTASDPSSNAFFGDSVSLSGDTAIVGAPLNDGNDSDAGAAYVFTRSNGVWTQQQRLHASDFAANDYFGGRLALSGDKAVVSSMLDDDGGVDAGSVYVFTRSGGVWTQEQKFKASDAAANDSFGISVALSGYSVIVGAYQDDNSGGVNAGAAYVFVPEGANAVPVVNAGSDQPATENAAFNLTASFTDADISDTHTATVNWGDGSSTESATVTEPSGSSPGTVNASHTYLALGTCTVIVTVTDNSNASGSDTLQVVVGTGVSGSYIQNTTTQQANANFNISGSGVVGGNLSVIGALNASGSGLTNLNASNITNGTLADARLSTNVATLSGVQTFADLKSFAGGISGDGAGLTNLNASNITSGTLDNARLSTVGVANGGTGIATAGASGNFLRSNGAGFTSAALTATDIPAGNTNYIQNTTTPQTAANFNVSGNGVVGGDLSVSGTLLASGSGLTNLNASNLTSGTLDNARLGSIPTGNIADGAITAPKIGNSAVTTTKIADSAVTAAKIGSNEVVKNLNGLTDSVTFAAGANVTITPAGNTLTIATNGGNFIQNSTTQQPASNFNISGNGLASNLTASGALSGGVVNAATQFNISGNRVLTTAGTNNIFAGFEAGLNNTTGDRNAFFGTQAGRNNLIGHTNSFVGYQAGYSNNNGTSNAFVGAYAGSANTEGYYNSFFGSTAGYSNTTAGNNSFFGTNAGRNNTTGYGNLFLGSFTGYYSTTGYNNSFVGTNAGLANTTGIANTLLGANSNVATNNLYFATAIGADATVSTSNTIVLGRSAGQDTVQIPGSVGIGTSTPNAQLHIMTPSTTGDALRLQRNVNTNGWGVAQYFGLKNSSSAATDYAAITGSILSNTAGSESGAIAFYTRNVGTLTEQARFDNNGNFGVGTTSPTTKLHVAGTITVDGTLKLNALGTAGGSSLCRNSSNQVAACSSSLRYKTNVAPFSFGLSLVQRLHPIRFEWKDGGMKDLGFGAEDVAGVEPLLVTYNASGQVEGVKYDRISAVLVNAVKEQQTQIETQQTQLEQQKIQLKAQQAQINQQQVLIDGLKKMLCRQNSRDPFCH